jgi:excisionase family DNA binding protein
VSALRVVTEDRRPFFTPRKLAAYLDVSERTVRQLLGDDEIPSYKVAGARRIAAEDVDAYLARHRSERR